jgi:hypothetical protein
MQIQTFIHKEYANLIYSVVEQVGVSHQSADLVLYIWQILAGGVRHYMRKKYKWKNTLTHFFPQYFIDDVNEFINKRELKNH